MVGVVRPLARVPLESAQHVVERLPAEVGLVAELLGEGLEQLPRRGVGGVGRQAELARADQVADGVPAALEALPRGGLGAVGALALGRHAVADDVVPLLVVVERPGEREPRGEHAVNQVGHQVHVLGLDEAVVAVLQLDAGQRVIHGHAREGVLLRLGEHRDVLRPRGLVVAPHLVVRARDLPRALRATDRVLPGEDLVEHLDDVGGVVVDVHGVVVVVAVLLSVLLQLVDVGQGHEVPDLRVVRLGQRLVERDAAQADARLAEELVDVHAVALGLLLGELPQRDHHVVGNAQGLVLLGFGARAGADTLHARDHVLLDLVVQLDALEREDVREHLHLVVGELDGEEEVHGAPNHLVEHVQLLALGVAEHHVAGHVVQALEDAGRELDGEVAHGERRRRLEHVVPDLDHAQLRHQPVEVLVGAELVRRAQRRGRVGVGREGQRLPLDLLLAVVVRRVLGQHGEQLHRVPAERVLAHLNVRGLRDLGVADRGVEHHDAGLLLPPQLVRAEPRVPGEPADDVLGAGLLDVRAAEEVRLAEVVILLVVGVRLLRAVRRRLRDVGAGVAREQGRAHLVAEEMRGPVGHVRVRDRHIVDRQVVVDALRLGVLDRLLSRRELLLVLGLRLRVRLHDALARRRLGPRLLERGEGRLGRVDGHADALGAVLAHPRLDVRPGERVGVVRVRGVVVVRADHVVDADVLPALVARLERALEEAVELAHVVVRLREELRAPDGGLVERGEQRRPDQYRPGHGRREEGAKELDDLLLLVVLLLHLLDELDQRVRLVVDHDDHVAVGARVLAEPLARQHVALLVVRVGEHLLGAQLGDVVLGQLFLVRRAHGERAGLDEARPPDLLVDLEQRAVLVGRDADADLDLVDLRGEVGERDRGLRLALARSRRDGERREGHVAVRKHALGVEDALRLLLGDGILDLLLRPRVEVGGLVARFVDGFAQRGVTHLDAVHLLGERLRKDRRLLLVERLLAPLLDLGGRAGQGVAVVEAVHDGGQVLLGSLGQVAVAILAARDRGNGAGAVKRVARQGAVGLAQLVLGLQQVLGLLQLLPHARERRDVAAAPLGRIGVLERNAGALQGAKVRVLEALVLRDCVGRILRRPVRHALLHELALALLAVIHLRR
ncbi:MAG: hypothetical protein CL844_03680 [Crocinitomicaceae bacterium]|nr:hypothetical protein [Crocinitomicaceae bacterium]